MQTQEAIQQINSQPLKPLYLILGTEFYLMEEVKQALINKTGLQKDDLDLMFFDMTQDYLNTVIAEAQTPSMWSETGQRLIFVENPYFLTADTKTKGPEHDFTDFLDYLKDPDPSAVVVFVAPYEKLDERKKITKALKKQAVLIETKPLEEKDARRYIQQAIDNAGLEMDRKAFETFLNLTELDISTAMNELGKLSLYTGGRGKVSQKTVMDLVPKSLAANIFDLTDHVLSGRAEAALRIYDDLRLQGEETIKLNAIILSQLRLLIQTQIMMKEGFQQAVIAQTVKVHPYRVKLAMQQSRKFPFQKLVSLYDELVENDYLVKSGQMDKELLFQLFVLKAAG